MRWDTQLFKDTSANEDNQMTEYNPLQEKIPDEFLDQVYDLARDLAYGVAQGWWDKHFIYVYGIEKIEFTIFKNGHQGVKQFENKWTMELWDYFHELFNHDFIKETEVGKGLDCHLTEAGFSLLRQPTISPSVFISCEGNQGYLLCLSLEERLSKRPVNSASITKSIETGDDWRKQSEIAIKDVDYFLCLVDEKSIYSERVYQELEWAELYRCRIILILHNDMNMINMQSAPSLYLEHQMFQLHRMIPVDQDQDALENRLSLIPLLNMMGYATDPFPLKHD